MKKWWAIVAVSAVLAVSALAQTNVYSKNAVGVIRVDVPPAGGLVLVGFNFKPLGTNVAFLSEVIGTNLPGHSIATRATRIHLWNPNAGGEYLSVYVHNGQFKTVVGGFVTNPMVASGEAFWIQSPSTSPTGFTVYVTGEVLSDVAVGREMWSGFMLVSNPYASDLDLNGTNINWTADGATAHSLASRADNVYIWNGAGYDGFYLRPDGKWYTIIGNQLATNAVIGLGRGAWYRARRDFTNAVTRPYPWW